METVYLLGSNSERIETMLKLAGWFENRQADITCAEKYYETNNIEMYDSAITFYKEFYGIEELWYIKVENPNWASDFEFRLFPKCFGHVDDKGIWHYADYCELIDGNNEVNSYANEECIIIGSIGYYYPATVWIDKKGNLFATHDYDNIIYKFNSILDLIEQELNKIEIDKVMMRTMSLERIDKEKYYYLKKV